MDPDANALDVANAILDSGWIPAVPGGSTWSIRLGDCPDADVAVFGYHANDRFGQQTRGGKATLRSMGMTRIDLRYHGQDRPDDVMKTLEARP